MYLMHCAPSARRCSLCVLRWSQPLCSCILLVLFSHCAFTASLVHVALLVFCMNVHICGFCVRTQGGGESLTPCGFLPRAQDLSYVPFSLLLALLQCTPCSCRPQLVVLLLATSSRPCQLGALITHQQCSKQYVAHLSTLTQSSFHQTHKRTLNGHVLL
jgi:hypothetical protein